LTAILRVDRKITNHRTVSRGMDVSPPGPWTCSTTFPAYSVKKNPTTMGETSWRRNFQGRTKYTR